MTHAVWIRFVLTWRGMLLLLLLNDMLLCFIGGHGHFMLHWLCLLGWHRALRVSKLLLLGLCLWGVLHVPGLMLGDLG